jgi:hypothetical protein
MEHRYRRATCCALLGVGVLWAAAASGHGTEAKGTRVLIRLQGYRVADPGGTPADELVLTARGVEHRFRVTDRRRFELTQAEITPARERDHLTLQADFDVLARFAKARPDQQVTILGEQRPGSGDLFVLTLDLCPP